MEAFCALVAVRFPTFFPPLDLVFATVLFFVAAFFLEELFGFPPELTLVAVRSNSLARLAALPRLEPIALATSVNGLSEFESFGIDPSRISDASIWSTAEDDCTTLLSGHSPV